MSDRFKILGTISLLLMSSPAYAGIDVERALESFHRICLAQGPDFERITATAGRLGWTPMAEDAFAPLTPLDNIQAMRGWRTMPTASRSHFERQGCADMHRRH
jgi:hypothetical protein